MELKDSSTVKIASNLLPEYLSIWSVRVKMRPYVNKIHKCYNCFRWGHSSKAVIFCKDKETCSRYGNEHNSDIMTVIAMLTVRDYIIRLMRPILSSINVKLLIPLWPFAMLISLKQRDYLKLKILPTLSKLNVRSNSQLFTLGMP